MEYYTYLYIDPKTDKPIYVGIGSGYRAKSHFAPSRTYKLGNVLRKRKREGHYIEPIIHFEEDFKTCQEMEKFWISFYGRENLGTGTLFNLTDGGEGTIGRKGHIPWNKGVPMTDETKEKVSQSLQGNGLGKPKSEEMRRKLSESKKGIKQSNEHKENIKAVKDTDEYKKKISEALKESWARRKK